jgi:hypothetical protein
MASTWSIEAMDPGCSPFYVIELQCLLSDLFLIFCSQHDLHFGIWHRATYHVYLLSPRLILYCSSFMYVCAYASCKCKSSSCLMYTVISFGSSTAMRLLSLLLGLCKNGVVSGIVVCLYLDSEMQLNVGIFVLGGTHTRWCLPHDIMLLCFPLS